jgi:hypothetical protein
MSATDVEKIVCRRCYAMLDAADNFCRHCGCPTREGVPGAASMAPALPAGPAWWEAPWLVLTMLFVVLGPLALPMLWRSRRFNNLWKIGLTVVVVALTVVVVWQVCVSVDRALAPLRELHLML